MHATGWWGPGRWPRAPRLGSAAILVLVLVVVVVAAGCGSDAGQGARLSESTPTARTGPDLTDADLWLSFEDDRVAYDGSTAFPDALGGEFVGRVVTANDGKVDRVPGVDGTGAAVAFPARCDAKSGCPRAMVEVAADPELDPGEEDFEYGASVLLAPDQTTKGSNIVQQGRFGAEGGQWKLQVDGDEGEPSCVVRSGATVLVVSSEVAIADAGWHHLTCRRDGEGLGISVDGAAEQAQGRTGSVSSALPVRVGSPGVGNRDDQFHGSIDDVFLRIGP
ncbi:MAG: hypothetical protein LH468_12090 [Nocardioides sp.]|nr:hypothetical protein [Nocardioides sp.]